jgi:GNAT superfamily N-acetyltransferase
MSEPLRDFSTPALVAAIEANQFAFWPVFASWMQVEIHDDSDMLWTISSIPFSMCNCVLRAQLTPDRVDAAIEAAITRCKARNVPMLWITGPTTRPADLGTHLQAHGFTYEGSEPGMAIDLLVLNKSLPTPPGLTFERARDVETHKTWCRVANAGFEMPDFVANVILDSFDPHLPIQNYLGSLSGEPVATSSLFLGAGVAGIYNVTTLASARRRGIGVAMTLATLCEARALGYRIGVLQSSKMGVSIYRRLGFQEYCKTSQYVWASRQVSSNTG